MILDLSFPREAAVNDGICSDRYLDEYDKLWFPSIDDLVRIIHKKGPACLLMKRDLSRAYRQLPANFGCVNLLGYWFEDNYWFDLMLPMGLKSSARCCQMVSSAVSYVFTERGFEAVNYIDDFGAVEAEDKAWDAFFELGKVIADFGLEEAEDKACPPSHQMIFLGLQVNTVDMTIKIPEDKFEEIKNVLTS